ncbi:MAG: hypothetical protein WBY61_00940 [Terriglobales bacterium]
MDTNKVAYWVALGVLALGLNSEYRHGNFVALHQAVERADFAMCGVTTRADRTLAAAIGGTGGSQFVAEAQSESASRLAEMQRAAIEQVRSRAESQFRLIDAGDGRMTVFCPKTRARVIVRRSDVSDDSPEIEVSDSF